MAPGKVLGDERAVETVFLAHEFDFFFRGVFTGHGDGRIAGHAKQHETHKGDRDAHGDRQPHPFKRVVNHEIADRLYCLWFRGSRRTEAPMNHFHVDRKKRGTSSGYGVNTRSLLKQLLLTQVNRGAQ